MERLRLQTSERPLLVGGVRYLVCGVDTPEFGRGGTKVETSQAAGEGGSIVVESELRKGDGASSVAVAVEAQLRELVDRVGSAS